MFIQTESTPNPATLKFLPGRVVLEGSPREFLTPEQAAVSPLAGALFEIAGVTGVFFGADFITVTSRDADWAHLKPAVLGVIMEHFMSGAPILTSVETAAGAEDFDPADAETVSSIKELLDTRVRPAVAADGGDITFRAYKDGVVYLNMRGACAGCPSSTATLRNGIQNLLRHFLPDVREVRAVA
ncbi:NifU family protein [Pleomorphomonas carboxyditropha]|uniref:NifU family protein n=1 Tax=Pleomorphomonas carboxyditropha TaxID=2023338 RepID=A0A2G9WYT8_9HYPH|nr:NifU family protein [Pleomorphomonas carboxyditropha]PIO99896.1 NifU family protein [Pleomorphomonas carboxyditropha]